MTEQYFYSLAITFLSGLLTDVFYGKYIKAVGDSHRYVAGNWSVLIGVCSIVFVQNVTLDLWHCFVWLVGLYIGTLIVVKKDNRDIKEVEYDEEIF